MIVFIYNFLLIISVVVFLIDLFSIIVNRKNMLRFQEYLKNYSDLESSDFKKQFGFDYSGMQIAGVKDKEDFKTLVAYYSFFLKHKYKQMNDPEGVEIVKKCYPLIIVVMYCYFLIMGIVVIMAVLLGIAHLLGVTLPTY